MKYSEVFKEMAEQEQRLADFHEKSALAYDQLAAAARDHEDLEEDTKDD